MLKSLYLFSSLNGFDYEEDIDYSFDHIDSCVCDGS